MLHRKPCRKITEWGTPRPPPCPGPLAHNQYTEYESAARPLAPRMLYYTVINIHNFNFVDYTHTLLRRNIIHTL